MPEFAASSAARPPGSSRPRRLFARNTGKDCKPDPSTNGKDCESHGNDAVGGVNEDHRLAATPTTTTDETTSSHMTTNQTTTSATTTNKTTTTPVTTTATDQASTISQTSTTATPGTTTTAAPSNGTLAASASTVTKPQLTRVLAKQVGTARSRRVSTERSASGQLPFTGFRGWILTLFGLSEVDSWLRHPATCRISE
jgi:hypothetical protein